VLSPAPTVTGVILGTPSYMSPEQARGKPADKRTDVWAFGCVLYEMLVGKQPFAGETVSDTVAAILQSEPNWRALPAATPSRIQSLIARCLKKDPSQRLRDVADGRFQIEETLSDSGTVAMAPTPARTVRAWAPWIAAMLFLGSTLFLAMRPSITMSSFVDPISFPIYPPPKAEFSARANTTFDVPSFALSPDGGALVFSAEMPGVRHGSPRAER
jgi:serine/threonine protein kinase